MPPASYVYKGGQPYWPKLRSTQEGRLASIRKVDSTETELNSSQVNG